MENAENVNREEGVNADVAADEPAQGTSETPVPGSANAPAGQDLTNEPGMTGDAAINAAQHEEGQQVEPEPEEEKPRTSADAGVLTGDLPDANAAGSTGEEAAPAAGATVTCPNCGHEFATAQADAPPAHSLSSPAQEAINANLAAKEEGQPTQAESLERPGDAPAQDAPADAQP